MKSLFTRDAGRVRLPQALRLMITLSLCLVAVANVFAQSTTDQSPVQPQQGSANRIVLPMVMQGNTALPPAPPAPPATRGGLFLDRTTKTASASTAIDANGGLHTAYVQFIPDAQRPSAVYGYCPGPASACASTAAWRWVRLGNLAQEAQLQLTPAGQPRLLIKTSSTRYTGGKDYLYAACDANCTAQSAWSVTCVLSSHGTESFDRSDQQLPQRSFALDQIGRPRFIYQDRNYAYAEPDHYGAYYVQCDADCTNTGNWQQTRISREIREPFRYDYEIFKHASLTFTKQGQPRLVANVFALNDDGTDAPDGVYYYACDAQCTSMASWDRLFLIPSGGGTYPHPGWDLELDAQNRPRVAIFTGDGLQPDDVNHRLLYIWCESDCLDGANWHFSKQVADQGDGESPDLELDAQGRPRIAWVKQGGMVGYAWCNTNCQSDPGQWRQQAIDTQAQLKQEFSQAVPSHCDQDLWTAVAPVLALDRSGNPHIAYDVPIEARCYYTDPSNPGAPPTYKFEPIWRAVRFTFFPQP